MSLASNLKELRKNINWTQREVSKHLSVNIKRYQAWEEGRGQPQLCMLVKLSRFHDITIDKLVLGAIHEKINSIKFKSGVKYHAHHNPSNEDWVILGIRNDLSEVCVAGWPPTIAKLTDCSNFKEVGNLSEDELNHRTRNFGEDWI